jgi:hypothetical protein
MSLLNKVLSFFGLGKAEVQEEPVVSFSQPRPKIVIEPVVESQETPVEVEIKVEAPAKPKPKTAASKRPKGSSSKSSTKTGTKKPSAPRKPRTPRKPKED